MKTWFKKKFSIYCLALLVIFSLTPEARGNPEALQLAGGLNTSWASRNDYGHANELKYVPEAFAYAYLPLHQHIFLRPGARIGFNGFQSEMPSSLQIKEYDLLLNGEVGVVYDWYLVPSLTLGYGAIFRTMRLVTSGAISAQDDKISGTEFLQFFQGQLGLGVPILQGVILVEPMIRYQYAPSDRRLGFGFGVETSVQIQ